jgi:hypothetical protein
LRANSSRIPTQNGAFGEQCQPEVLNDGVIPILFGRSMLHADSSDRQVDH